VVPGICQPRGGAVCIWLRQCILEETAKYFRHAEVTGVPVRQAFFEIPGFLSNKKRGGVPTLLVFGGKPGGSAINEAMIRCLPNCSGRRPVCTSFIRRGSVTYNDALAAYQSSSSAGVSRPRFSSLLKTCRRRLRGRIW